MNFIEAPSPNFDARTAPLEPGLTRVTVTVENRGYLPTGILASAKELTHNEPLWADAQKTYGKEMFGMVPGA